MATQNPTTNRQRLNRLDWLSLTVFLSPLWLAVIL
jgi:hypothetical protein